MIINKQRNAIFRTSIALYQYGVLFRVFSFVIITMHNPL